VKVPTEETVLQLEVVPPFIVPPFVIVPDADTAPVIVRELELEIFRTPDKVPPNVREPLFEMSLARAVVPVRDAVAPLFTVKVLLPVIV
jgi:hypothetical protein